MLKSESPGTPGFGTLSGTRVYGQNADGTPHHVPVKSEPCIHPGLFSVNESDGSCDLDRTQVCGACNQAIPNRDL